MSCGSGGCGGGFTTGVGSTKTKSVDYSQWSGLQIFLANLLGLVVIGGTIGLIIWGNSDNNSKQPKELLRENSTEVAFVNPSNAENC